MKTIGFLMILFVFSETSIAQELINTPEYRILFRNHDNIVQFDAVNFSHTAKIIGSDSVSITPTKDPSTYIVRTSTKTLSTDLYLVDQVTQDTLFQYMFRLRNLPLPSAYIGEIKNGGVIDLKQVNIDYGYYGHLVPKSLSYTVLEYQLTIGESTTVYSGKDKALSKEAVAAIQKALAEPHDFIPIYLQLTVTLPDGVARKVSSTFFVQ